MKKILLVLSLIFLAGCGSKGSDSSAPTPPPTVQFLEFKSVYIPELSKTYSYYMYRVDTTSNQLSQLVANDLYSRTAIRFYAINSYVYPNNSLSSSLISAMNSVGANLSVVLLNDKTFIANVIYPNGLIETDFGDWRY